MGNTSSDNDMSIQEQCKADSGSISVAVVYSLDELAHYRKSWNNLARECGGGALTSGYDWVSSFLQHRVAVSQKWVCLLALSGDELVGVLPLIYPAADQAQTGRHLSSPHDTNTTSVEPVIAPGGEAVVVDRLISELTTIMSSWFKMELPRLPEDSPVINLSHRGPSGARLFLDYDGTGSFVNTTGSFESYRAGLSANFRKNLKKAGKKLEQLAGVRTEFVKSCRQDDSLFRQFTNLEASGWKGREGTAVAQSASINEFYRVLTSRLAESHVLEWHFLYAEGKPIATHLAAHINRRLVVTKIAYDEEYSRCSPGNLLFHAVLERAFESDDVDVVDCLTDMVWHRNWQMDRRRYYNVLLFPKRMKPTILGYLPLILLDAMRQVPGIKSGLRLVRRLREG
jgi:CelD/BcsL family acetyltransferase involved in cellulose biosynthesis